MSGDYLDTLHDVGLVFATYVVVVLAATARRAGTKFWHVVFIPLRAWGELALSLYLLHVSFIAWWSLTQGGRPQQNSLIGWFVIVVLPLLIAWLWWRFVGTGPVEWMLGWVSGRRKTWRKQPLAR